MYIKCPVCQKMMNRVKFGTRSGVVIDRCKADGVWLDSGELKHLFEWSKAGGQILDKDRREEEKKRKEKEMSRKTQQQYMNQPIDHSSCFESFGSSSHGDEVDLINLVSKLATRFFR